MRILTYLILGLLVRVSDKWGECRGDMLSILIISFPSYVIIQYQGEVERGGERCQGVEERLLRVESGQEKRGKKRKRVKRDIPKFPPQDPSILGKSFALAT